MASMRIAILHYTLPPTIGGVERVVGEQADALRAMGHEVVLFDRSADSRARFANWLKERGRPRPHSSDLAPSDFRSADEGVRAPASSVVIAHNVFTMPFDLEWTRELMGLAEARRDVKWINWVHDVRWADKVPQAVHVAVSEHRRAEYGRRTREPVHVIPNGCDFAGVLGLTERVALMRLERAPLVLLHPARLVRRKNIELGLRVLAHLPGAIYLVTGAPDPHQKDGVIYLRELKRLARELGVADRVRFPSEKGALDDADVRGLYQMADALFFPSTQEGYGLPLIEAAFHSVPVFCSAIPPHREVAAADARFFRVTSAPRTLARRIRTDAAVRARQERRAAMRRLAWPQIIAERLVPLLLREGSPSVRSNDPLFQKRRNPDRGGSAAW